MLNPGHWVESDMQTTTIDRVHIPPRVHSLGYICRLVQLIIPSNYNDALELTSRVNLVYRESCLKLTCHPFLCNDGATNLSDEQNRTGESDTDLTRLV